MARPALSASRSMDVIDFLAAFPGRAFTLSEIAKAAKMNLASCHAVLSALTSQGYLSRCPKQRTYLLGRTLIAVGQAALQSQPLVARAKEAAEELFAELGVPVLLSTVVRDEVVGILSISDAAGRDPGLKVGERVPLVAPVGGPFLAWSTEEAIERWISRHTDPTPDALVAEWRHTLELTRRRGFQVTLRSQEGPGIAALMAQLAAGRHVPYYKDEVTRLFSSFDHHLSQPETIEADLLYDIILIAAPLFDQQGEAAFNLCLGGFAEKLTGATITAYADRLVRTCVRLMRESRAQA